jgi:hypothetical protein
MRLQRGMTVRCIGVGTDADVTGVIVIASPNGQSVAVLLPEPLLINNAVLSALMLTVDYEAETVTDLFGNEWEVYVAGTEETP